MSATSISGATIVIANNKVENHLRGRGVVEDDECVLNFVRGD